MLVDVQSAEGDAGKCWLTGRLHFVLFLGERGIGGRVGGGGDLWEVVVGKVDVVSGLDCVALCLVPKIPHALAMCLEKTTNTTPVRVCQMR